VLVIPTEHVESVAEPLDAVVAADLLAVAARVAAAEGLDEGWRLVSNVGAGAGQSVFHLHFHVIGGRSLAWPPG
jgi:histidine triad (HIT) family protein